ncbi:hypothetical protein, partial [Acetobacter sp.]
PLFNVKKSRLFHSAIPPTRTRKMESQRRPQYQEVFRTLQFLAKEDSIIDAKCFSKYIEYFSLGTSERLFPCHFANQQSNPD